MNNRVIKFRAWDEKEKKMLLDIVGVHDDCPIQPDYTGYYHSLEAMPVMQFTGLLDRHGKEIWESDITNYGEVVWVAESARFRINPSKENRDVSFTESLMNYDDIEVIGNPYQNPELLDQKK